MATINATHAPNAYQGTTTLQKGSIAAAGLITLVLHQIFRRSAYRHSCDHLQPSFEKNQCLEFYGRILGYESCLVVTIVCIGFYCFIVRMNRGAERLHQE